MPALELLLICITYWNKTDTHPPLDSFIVSLLGLLVKAHPDPCHLGSAHMIWTMTDTGVHADKNFTSTPPISDISRIHCMQGSRVVGSPLYPSHIVPYLDGKAAAVTAL